MAKKKKNDVETEVEAETVETEPIEELLTPSLVPVEDFAPGTFYATRYKDEFVVFEVGITQDAAPEGQILVAQIQQGNRSNGQYWERENLIPAVQVTKEQAYNLSRNPNYYGEGYNFG